MRAQGGDLEIEFDLGARRQGHDELGAVAAQPVRGDGKGDPAGAQNTIEPLVAQQHAALTDLGRQQPAASRAGLAAHLERVAEIGGEIDAQRQHRSV